jgi:molybdopterin-biosynthesis enzyme MoeA-like protein
MTSNTITFGLIIIGDEILSGKRQDGHFAKVREILAVRGLQLSWVQYLGDDRTRCEAVLVLRRMTTRAKPPLPPSHCRCSCTPKRRD